MEGLLLPAFVFLAAGCIAVPIATRLGLGSVLGYLLAGIALSPLLSRLGVDVISIQHIAEFGVVMMLFLVGLELEPKLLWKMRARLLGLGGLQVTLTTLVVTGAGMALGLPWNFALAIGLTLALSSTAIVLQTLNEKGLMKSDGGQGSFSVLLFQDIAVIPMLALLPLLAAPEMVADWGAGGEVLGAGVDDHGETDTPWIDTLSGPMRALVTISAIAAVVLGGSVLTRPLFTFIARSGLREMFTATALVLVIGIALLMGVVGLSAALGTFLAGVVLANSEYRHELESDIDPFKGLLLGLFFITVGAGIDFGLLGQEWLTVAGLVIGLMAAKAAILFALGTVFGLRGGDRWLLTLGLAQAGEFGFVLLSFTVANNVLPVALADLLLLVVAISMLLTPLLFILHDRVIAKAMSAGQAREADEISPDGRIIIAGLGRMGSVINRILTTNGHDCTVIDNSSEQLERLRAFGVKVFYGDASRPDLLHAAGIEDAQLLIVTIDDEDQTENIVRHVVQQYPHVHVIARAFDRRSVYRLWAAGCRDIIRETFDSATRMGRSALEALGESREDAEMRIERYLDQDNRTMREMAEHYDPDIPLHRNDAFIAKAREVRERESAAMRDAEGNVLKPQRQRLRHAPENLNPDIEFVEGND